MAIEIFPVFSVVDDSLVEEMALPQRAEFLHGDVVSILSNCPARGDGTGPSWVVSILIGQGASARRVALRLEEFLTPDEYRESTAVPFSFARLAASIDWTANDWLARFKAPDLNWLWLYRDTFYATHRAPQPSEIEEAVLRIKVQHYQRDEKLKRLREQVANCEAIEGQDRASATIRKTIPDDVKLLVWSRDKGACVRCGGSKELHFDHIIPLARGGSDEAVNIQLLCRTCNLAKGDRIV